MTRVVVLGAGGIIGQHMMISVPDGVEATFFRRSRSDIGTSNIDLLNWDEAAYILDHLKPEAVINLAGESRPDIVEAKPEKFHDLNAYVPIRLSKWCDANEADLIHLGTQASFTQPGPSGPPANHYGYQKAAAEGWLQEYGANWVIVRPTFVLGIRPFPGIGRSNPAEQFLSGEQLKQVNDRQFSISFAWEVAEELWGLAMNPHKVRKQAFNVGAGTFTRYALATAVNPHGVFEPCNHDELGPLAPRGHDTTYQAGAWNGRPALENFLRLQWEFKERAGDTIEHRAKELAAFLAMPRRVVQGILDRGFGPLHNAVAADFRHANPVGPAALHQWYKSTDAYLWELTAYHSDAGFNYRGMIEGIVTRLRQLPVRRGKFAPMVLCLGDGTGDLSLALHAAGFTPVYNDVAQSRIQKFASARFNMRLGDDHAESILMRVSADSNPPFSGDVAGQEFDAIASLDFLEHMPHVDTWVREIYRNLRPGGLFCAQNAFGIGSGPKGSIPMHLAENDRFEKDWDPLLASIGFIQEASNWYRKPGGDL